MNQIYFKQRIPTCAFPVALSLIGTISKISHLLGILLFAADFEQHRQLRGHASQAVFKGNRIPPLIFLLRPIWPILGAKSPYRLQQVLSGMNNNIFRVGGAFVDDQCWLVF